MENLAPRRATSSGDSFPIGHSTYLGFGELYNTEGLHMTLPLCAAQWSEIVHRAFNEIFDEYGPRMALLFPMKLVNIGN
eukprot:6017597-Karenia_brevis.AAC.1